MARKKGQEKIPGSGRRKGSLNKTTVQLKEAVLRAFDKLGGEDWLVNILAEKDPAAFASLLRTILPKDIKAEISPSASFAQLVIQAWKNGSGN